MNFILIPNPGWKQKNVHLNILLNIKFCLDLIPQLHSCYPNSFLKNNNKKWRDKQANQLNKFRLYRLPGKLSKPDLDEAACFFLHALTERNRQLEEHSRRSILIRPHQYQGSLWANWLRPGLWTNRGWNFSDWFRQMFFNRSNADILSTMIFFVWILFLFYLSFNIPTPTQ